MDNTISKNVEELRAVYINRLVAKLSGFRSFNLGKDVTVLDAVEDEFFNQIKKASDVIYNKYEHQQYHSRYVLVDSVSSGIKFSSVEKEISNELTYEQREKLLQDRINNQLDVLKAEKEKVRSKIIELESLSIQEIFGLIDIANYLGEFRDSYLMRNLLLNGYIDDHFEDYISLFHEISLTKDDFFFERSVKSGVSLQFDYQLSKTENLIKRLPEKYFKREAIYNYIILECLLESEFKYKIKLDNFYKGLNVDGEKQFQFIYGFINSNPKKIAHFIKNLCVTKPGLWRSINIESELPDDEIRKLISIIFEHADISAILRLEDIESLIKYFEQLPDIFAFYSSFKNVNNIHKFISDRKLRFESLDLPVEAQKQLFDLVYTKNHYQINAHNIQAVIQGNRKEYNAGELSRAHYTTILKLDLKHLNNYISSNIEGYISNVMTLLVDNTNEAEETVINILNRGDVKLSLKEKVLESQEVLIQSTSDIVDIEVQQVV